MKKQISVFAVTITAMVFFSCSKQEKDIPQPQSSVDQQQMSNSINPPFILIDPLEVSLSGRYEFDSNLKDRTGKLARRAAHRGFRQRRWPQVFRRAGADRWCSR